MISLKELRRSGAPSVLIASNEKAGRMLSWHPTKGLDQVIADAWEWHSRHPEGYGK